MCGPVTGLTEGIHLARRQWALVAGPHPRQIVFSTYLGQVSTHGRRQEFPAASSGQWERPPLRRLARGLPGPGVVRAKTGTLDNSATLVGYLGRNDGTLVIAAMYNGTEGAWRAPWPECRISFRTLGGQRHRGFRWMMRRWVVGTPVGQGTSSLQGQIHLPPRVISSVYHDSIAHPPNIAGWNR